jgi:mono/diheme cytochrome c family protein
MKSWVLGTVVAGAALGSGAYFSTLSGQGLAEPQTSAASFQQTVLPILEKNCFSCHSDRVHSGNLSLEAFRDAALVTEKPEVWTKVLDKVKAGTMPPRTMPPLSGTDAAAITGWIERMHGGPAPAVADSTSVDPGRVTARRLNRTEYNNTIRDLLGIALRPADEFPTDDSGYGFDNIGDVLSVSPLLMEKYLSAARSVSKVAVFGETYPLKPTLLVRLLPKKIQDDEQVAGNVTPFSARGSLYATYRAPVDAEYEFRFRYQNFRGGEPVITTDGPARGAGGARGARGAIDAPAVAGGPGPAAEPGAPGAQGRGAGRGRGGFVPRPVTDEERKARYERARTAAPPEPLVFKIDGKEVFSYVVQGTTDYEYSRGESVVRVKLAAGDHALRASFPGLANIADPRTQFNVDARRKLYMEYMDVLGPYSPSTERPASFKKIFVCAPETSGRYSDACTKKIVETFATRAYRRPATPPEVGRLVSLVAQVQKRDSFEEAIRVAVQAVLTSPNFLFRVEQDPPAQKGAAYHVSDYELASRLSYFLWSSMPDDALFEAAAQNTLHEKDTLDGQIRRMLMDPKASALAENFGEQWLNLRLMDRKKPDAAKFDKVDDELLDAMRQETLMFVGAVIREDRSILDFIDGKFTFVNGPLARYYGIPGVDGEQLQRVELDGAQRSGIVTQGSILSISSYATRTSPVLRGKWVLDTLLGAAPPPPPDGIPALVEKDLGTAASMRQRLEQHRADPSCAACHNAMDPIGFGLENYDAAGAWRTKDGNFDIDSSGTLPDGRSFKGAQELKAILRAKSDIFTRNFTEKLLTYALGRGLERTDRAVVDQITNDLAHNNYKFSTLVADITRSRPFQMRARVTGDGGN